MNIKSNLLLIGLGCLLFASCSKSPEKIVNEVYENAKNHQFAKIANLILPDSIDPLNEEELERFSYLMESAMKGAEYNEVTVDSVTVNPEGTEARFTVTTKFQDGKSFTEKGTLRKTASDRWRLLASKEQSDTVPVFTITNKDKHTPELMRNLDFAMAEFLAGRGIPQYQVLTGDYYDKGIMVKGDKKKAFELYENAAEKDYVTAYRRLGWAYYNGNGVKKDLEKSFEWYQKAAEAGDTRAYYSLAYHYSNGVGTMRDYDKAIEWYKKAMEANDPSAYNNLAVMYSNGQGVEKDLTKAHDLTVKAYELGQQQEADDESIGIWEDNLGRDFQYGKGVDKDIQKALEYYKKSADHGNVDGMTDLASVYYNGTDGIDKDYDKALYWYKKAADKKDTYARIMVAECYEYGRGVDMNKTTAMNMYKEIHRDTQNKYALNAWLRLDR